MLDNEERVHPRSGVQLVRMLAERGERVFSTQRAREIAPVAGISEDYLRQALHYLVRAGWLVRLRKGLYAIASTTPGVAPAHEFEVAMHLVDPAAVGFRSAMLFHGMTDQVPNLVYVLTTNEVSIPRTRGSKSLESKPRIHRIGNADYRFVRVKPERFFGVCQTWISEARITVTDPERTLVDGLSKPRYCGGFAGVLHAFRARASSLDVDRVVEYALRLDTAVAKRLGWVLDNLGVGRDEIFRLENLPVRGYRLLNPSGPRRGPCTARWMIRENLPGSVRKKQE